MTCSDQEHLRGPEDVSEFEEGAITTCPTFEEVTQELPLHLTEHLTYPPRVQSGRSLELVDDESGAAVNSVSTGAQENVSVNGAMRPNDELEDIRQNMQPREPDGSSASRCLKTLPTKSHSEPSGSAYNLRRPLGFSKRLATAGAILTMITGCASRGFGPLTSTWVQAAPKDDGLPPKDIWESDGQQDGVVQGLTVACCACKEYLRLIMNLLTAAFIWVCLKRLQKQQRRLQRQCVRACMGIMVASLVICAAMAMWLKSGGVVREGTKQPPANPLASARSFWHHWVMEGASPAGGFPPRPMWMASAAPPQAVVMMPGHENLGGGPTPVCSAILWVWLMGAMASTMYLHTLSSGLAAQRQLLEEQLSSATDQILAE